MAVVLNKKNNVKLKIEAPMTSVSNLLIVDKGELLGDDFTSAETEKHFKGTLFKFDGENVSQIEISKVITKSGNFLTLERAVEPCPMNYSSNQMYQQAYDFEAGDWFYVNLTAGDLEDIITELKNTNTRIDTTNTNILNNYVSNQALEDQKGQPGGIATLDENSKIPGTQINTATLEMSALNQEFIAGENIQAGNVVYIKTPTANILLGTTINYDSIYQQVDSITLGTLEITTRGKLVEIDLDYQTRSLYGGSISLVKDSVTYASIGITATDGQQKINKYYFNVDVLPGTYDIVFGGKPSGGYTRIDIYPTTKFLIEESYVLQPFQEGSSTYNSADKFLLGSFDGLSNYFIERISYVYDNSYGSSTVNERDIFLTFEKNGNIVWQSDTVHINTLYKTYNNTLNFNVLQELESGTYEIYFNKTTSGNLSLVYLKQATSLFFVKKGNSILYKVTNRVFESAIGIAQETKNQGENVKVLIQGVFDNYSSLEIGKKYYFDNGIISRTDNGNKIGIALSNNSLFLNIEKEKKSQVIGFTVNIPGTTSGSISATIAIAHNLGRKPVMGVITTEAAVKLTSFTGDVTLQSTGGVNTSTYTRILARVDEDNIYVYYFNNTMSASRSYTVLVY